MCGICGIVNQSSKIPPNQAEIEAMCGLLAHRGPDGYRTLLREGMGLGHTRLSVIDIETGWQPISNENGNVWVAFNGEIYNYRELRDELRSHGHTFATESDTEVIVHLYEEVGDNLVTKLRGMFAFALWDEPKQRLVLACDRIGKKPIYYAEVGNELIFASEVRALIQNPRVSKEVDLQSVYQYLSYGYIAAPRSIFKNIHKVPPAHLLVREKGHTQLKHYWTLDFTNQGGSSLSDYIDGIREHLTDAVRVRLESDVPLGFFLSGGIDSSLVVAIASSLAKGRIKTFSIGFDESTYSELPYAKTIARRFNTDHEELTVDPNIIDVFHDTIRAAGEPFADSSMIPTYLLAKMSRSKVTVALGGDGGDEVFGGYDRYSGIKFGTMYERVPRVIRDQFLGPISARLPESTRKRDVVRQIKRFLAAPSGSAQAKYASWMRHFSPQQLESICSPEFLEGMNAIHERDDPVLDAFGRAPAQDNVSAAQWVDTMTYLPGDLMVKADRMSMAHGLELRSPFLDHKLMEFVATIPSKFKVRGFTKKYILKKAFSDLLPEEITKRPKEGFSIPLAAWLRGELREISHELLRSPSSKISAIVNANAVARILDDHIAGEANHSTQIWNLLCLEAWARESGTELG